MRQLIDLGMHMVTEKAKSALATSDKLATADAAKASRREPICACPVPVHNHI